jgi:hypothetical protein
MKVTILLSFWALFFSFLPDHVHAEGFYLCLGNHETGLEKIVETSVDYFLWYKFVGEKAKVRFAGREFEAKVSYGQFYEGPWLQNHGDMETFSFLPGDGGTVTFQFNEELWFKGNCIKR